MSRPPNPMSPRGVNPAMISSIRQRSRAAGVDFGALMAQAKEESGFRVDAKSSSSSARGLLQFIDSTWLGLVQRFG
ncbi:MAG TPA: transglycosylase SLT domain-containing protein, partial [Stellaceae bacterium]|nr:transglycosylase SLT domain-containing protein [Stellaceae bacterium]